MAQVTFAGRTAISFLTFNLGWWACALGATHGYPWAGPALIPLWVAVHLRFSPIPLAELLFFIELGAFGWVLDSLLMKLGLFTLATPSNFAPLWLVAMWILLGLTYEGMLGLRSRPRTLLVMGALTGPLSYVWCEAVQLLTYARPLWAALAIHALIWGALTPLLFRLRDHATYLLKPRVRATSQFHPAVAPRVAEPLPEPVLVALPEAEPGHYKDPTAPTWH